MESSVLTSKGQIVVPARLRKRHGLKPGTKVFFVERDGDIVLVPVTLEHVRGLHGLLAGAGPAAGELLAERARDRAREEGRGAARRAR